LLDEEERGPRIVGAATGEVGFAEFRPEGIVKGATVRREADDLPTGVLAKGLADIGGGGGREGLGKHGRVPQQHLEFEQNEFTDCDVLAILERFKKCRCSRGIDVSGFDGWQKDIGVQRDHRLARLRLLSSSAAMSRRISKGTLMPPASTRGSCHAPRAVSLFGKPVEKQFQSAAGDLGEGQLPLRSEGFGPLVKCVWELNLGARHAVNFTSLGDDVNSQDRTAQSCGMGSWRCNPESPQTPAQKDYIRNWNVAR
jgi:hypothetical protein